MLKDKRILIIDDSETFLVFLHGLLTDQGAIVDVAKSGEEGLDRHAQEPAYDLILLDLMMPDINGLDTLRRIRHQDEHSTVILLTGAGDIKSAVTAVRSGADGYTEKQDLQPGEKTEAFFLALEQAMQHRAGLIVQNELQERLHHISLHDALTGLYNRAFFQEEMSRLGKSRQFPVSVLVADVNWLKETNDEFGHAAGDELLQRAAEVLRRSFRAEDVIARIGGDEFVVLMPRTDAGTVKKALERVRKRLETVNTERGGVALSLACGAATAEYGESLAEAIKRADKAMYSQKERQKAAGRTHEATGPEG
jgi:diguanylate cyclase (GGDEF)-like protein